MGCSSPSLHSVGVEPVTRYITESAMHGWYDVRPTLPYFMLRQCLVTRACLDGEQLAKSHYMTTTGQRSNWSTLGRESGNLTVAADLA